MGVYGMLRICWPIFPDAFGYFQYAIADYWCHRYCIWSIMCFGQHKVGERDLKKMIAYSSVSQWDTLCWALQLLTRKVLQALYFRCLITVQLPLCYSLLLVLFMTALTLVAWTISVDLQTRCRFITGLMSIAFFAAIGLPGLSGFVSEIMVFIGGFKAFPVPTMFAGLGIVLGATYMLWALQKIFFGKPNPRWKVLGIQQVKSIKQMMLTL
jgi:NADH-quinone oxidoreductase subunit M